MIRWARSSLTYVLELHLWKQQFERRLDNGFVSHRKSVFFLLHKTLIDGQESCALLVDLAVMFCGVFIILTAPI